MGYRRFFLFVEGNDDARFFERVLTPHLKSSYDYVAPTIQYSNRKREYLDGYLKTIRGMDADYLFVGDLDDFPCAMAKKRSVVTFLPRLKAERILVVKAEIESWYCAGIGEEHPRFGRLDFAQCQDTSAITKERLKQSVAPRSERLEAMIELLEAFDPETATRRNESFRYFARKFLRSAD